MSAPRSSSSRLPRLFLAGTVLLASAGCAAVLPPSPSIRPVPPEAQRLIETLERRWAQFADLRALAEITTKKGDESQRLTGVLLLLAPASLRFEALTPWGQPFLLLASTGESFTLYQVAENRAVVGPAGAEATERWLGLALEPEALVGVLSGHVLPLRNPHSAEILENDELGPSLKLTGEGGEQRIWLDPETAAPRQVEFTGGRTPVRISYSGGGAVAPPSALTLTALDQSLTVSIRYRELSFGVGLSSDLFHLTIPKHAKIKRFR